MADELLEAQDRPPLADSSPLGLSATSKFRGDAASAMHAAGARLITVPISAVLALATTKVVINGYGLSAYGVFALVLGIPALLPSRDLGLGAKVIDVVARRSVLGDSEVAATLGNALGRVGRIALVAVVVAVGVQLVIGWHLLLGHTTSHIPEFAITAAICLFLLSLPGGLSINVLWGLRRIDLVALQAPVLTFATFVAVLLTWLAGLPVWVAIVVAMALNALTQWISLY